MRQRLAALALVLGLGELVDSFFISGWYFALVFAVLFFVGAWLVHGAGDWIFQIAFLAVAAVTLVLSVVLCIRKLTLT
jgi:hypothetical protein